MWDFTHLVLILPVPKSCFTSWVVDTVVDDIILFYLLRVVFITMFSLVD